jgi:2-polyprenyl-3-methyl-5-hydroxy-6-metoxy-1,4-benzoquinol methylase
MPASFAPGYIVPPPAMPNDRYVESCPLGCEAPLAATQLVLPEGPLLRCTACGQLLSQVDAERYRATMQQFDRADFHRTNPRERERLHAVARRRLRAIAALLRKPPQQVSLLDVGCSRGYFVETAAAMGFAAEGVEPSQQLAAQARASGLAVHAGLLEEQRFPDARFDALTLFEVIEHLREPRSLLAEMRRVLRPGGLLLLSTGNSASWTAAVLGAHWDYFHIAQNGGHVSFFRPESVRLLAARCGFSTERIETRRVKFHERGDVPPARYRLWKAAAELLNYPARWLGKGHDMLAYLRRPAAETGRR